MKDQNKIFIRNFIIGALLLAGIVTMLNIIFDNINIGRIDLTANNVYTLSPAVEKILSKLEAPIEATYYVSSSEKMPTKWKNLQRDVIDKLKDIKRFSRGMFDYKVFDPSKEEEKEAYLEQKRRQEQNKDIIEKKRKKISRKKIAERLAEKGVIPFGVQSTSRDEFAVKRVYSSIVLSYLDRKEEVIEEVRPETFGSLEYEIMSRIYKLVSNHKPRIGFYPGVPEIPPQMMQYYRQSPPDMYEYTVQLLEQSGYNVKRSNITKDDPIPDDIETMILMLDQPLNERQMYEIDKLVHKGVRLIMCGQQFNYSITQSRTRPGEFDLRCMPTGLNINSLTREWGFEFGTEVFMDRNSAYIQVPVNQIRSFGAFRIQQQRLEPVTKPVIIRVNPENINSNISISNKISTLFYMYGGRLIVHDDILKEQNLKHTVLFTSSNQSWTMTGRMYGILDTSPPGPEDILRHQPLGILLEGKFKSKYKGKTVPKWETAPADSTKEEEEEQSEITGEAEENKIIAIGCSNMFKSNILQSVEDHKNFLRNCVDALTLGDDLIKIRSKNIMTRRIRTTSSIGKALTKIFVVWFSPVVFVIAGFYITIRRRKK